jgi:NAD(P)H-dependent FMN reductase
LLAVVQVVGISGSLKDGSANSALLRTMAAEAAGELVVWDGLGDLRYFAPDVDGGEAVQSLRRAVADADAVLIATPEYAGGMPGALKNALDWLVGTGELYGKAVVVVSAAPAAARGASARRGVEAVARMQGAHMSDSFTVAVAGPDDSGAVVARAREVWARVRGGLSGAARAPVGSLERVAPILPVRDLDASMAHYRRMGFSTRVYEGGGYGFATREDVELHLGVVPDSDRGTSSAYLFVDDADRLADEWRAAGVHVHEPQDTAWGRHEGVVVDPDGNVIRFGSPM